ncbi:MAG: restriction endonuclease subunit S [Desulfuromonadaceae bacterium]|nr:restriction endonuclease subunit S [Desulfuromonadaceae bacterium]
MSKFWPLVALGEVISHCQEYIDAPESRSYPKLSVKLYGKGVVLDTPADGNLLKMKRHQLAKAGQVILSEIWGKKGAIGFVPPIGEGALCTSHFFLFDVRNDRLDPKWLQALFSANYLQEQLDADAKGTTGYAAVRPKNLFAAIIPLPPLAEQQRIVARIDELTAKIGEARGLRQQAVAEAEALSRSAVEAVYQGLAARFGQSTLSDTCTSITDGDHNTPQFSDSGIKFIFVGNVSSGKLHFNNSKKVSETYFNSLKPHRVPARGDILYSAVGATLGIATVVDTDEPFCFQRHIAILKPNRKIVESRYVWHMLNSQTVFEKTWSSTTGTAQPTVPLRAIRELPLPLPTISEQRHIVSYLDDLLAKIFELKHLQAETAAELDAMLPSILDKAFKGEL